MIPLLTLRWFPVRVAIRGGMRAKWYGQWLAFAPASLLAGAFLSLALPGQAAAAARKPTCDKGKFVGGNARSRDPGFSDACLIIARLLAGGVGMSAHLASAMSPPQR